MRILLLLPFFPISRANIHDNDFFPHPRFSRSSIGIFWLKLAHGPFLDTLSALFYNQIEVNRPKRRSCIKRSIAFVALFSVFFFTPIEKASGQDTLIKLKVVAEQANIRLEPDISSIIIRQVPKGTILNATEEREDWFAVQLTPKQGTTVSGFVHESLVEVIEPRPEKKKPPDIPKKEKKEQEPVLPPPVIEQKESQETIPFQFTLSITGGGNFIRGGDINLGVKGLADLYEDILGIKGKGEIESVHLGYIFGLEISFPLSEILSWGVGVEHFQGKNESTMDFSQGSSSSILLTRPNIHATPVSLFLSLNPVPGLYVKGGVSYSFAKYSYVYLLQNDDATQRWEGNANARGLGLSGGLGLLKGLSSNLSLFAEIAGRFSKIKGFKGKETFQDSSGANSTENGTLYLIQTQVLADRTHPVLFIRETRPNEAGVIDSAEARIDLSGMSIRIGLRLHF